MFEISAWIIKGKRYVVFGRGPSCVYDWRLHLKDKSLTDNDIRYVKSWYETHDILRTDFNIVDLQKIAYPGL